MSFNKIQKHFDALARCVQVLNLGKVKIVQHTLWPLGTGCAPTYRLKKLPEIFPYRIDVHGLLGTCRLARRAEFPLPSGLPDIAPVVRSIARPQESLSIDKGLQQMH